MVSDRVTSDGCGERRERKGGDHVTAIKQIVRVGTTCSTVDERAGEVSGRETGWSASCNGERVAAGGTLRGKGGGRSTTPRTTRTCVCKMITRVHALARGRALAHTHMRASR